MIQTTWWYLCFLCSPNKWNILFKWLRFDGVPLKPGHLRSSGLGSANQGFHLNNKVSKIKSNNFITRIIKPEGCPCKKGITFVNLSDELEIISWKFATWVIELYKKRKKKERTDEKIVEKSGVS